MKLMANIYTVVIVYCCDAIFSSTVIPVATSKLFLSDLLTSTLILVSPNS